MAAPSAVACSGLTVEQIGAANQSWEQDNIWKLQSEYLLHVITPGSCKELRERGVPEESIVFLTRSESEAKTIAKELGAFVGGFVGGAAGMTAGVVAASLLLPGIGTVFALGIGAAALLTGAGAGAGAGTAMGSAAHTTRTRRNRQRLKEL